MSSGVTHGRRAAALTCAIGLAAGVTASAQTFRAGVTLVPVDVRVIDAEGKPVTDLKAFDFTIVDNGVPQEIAQFATRSYESGSGAPRTFVILLGRGRLNTPGNAITALIAFVRSQLSPTDRVAVHAYLRATELTTDHAGVIRFLENYRSYHEAIEGRLARDARAPGKPLAVETTQAIERLFQVPGLPAVQLLPNAAGGRYVGHTDYTYLLRTIEHLRHVDGEKQLMFLSEHVASLGARAAELVGRRATAGRVAVSIIQTGGDSGAQKIRRGRVLPDRADGWSSSLEEAKSAANRALAHMTGGLSTFYQDPRAPLATIGLATRFDYLVGYYPTTPPAEGEYRSLRVEVNRPGATALYRHGYQARRATEGPYDVRRTFADLRILEAAESAQSLTALPVKVSASATPISNGGTRLNVDIIIDSSRVTFTPSSAGDYTGALDISLFVGDRVQNPLTEQRAHVEVKRGTDASGRTASVPIRHSMTVHTGREPGYLKVVVYDYDADRLGTATLKLK